MLKRLYGKNLQDGIYKKGQSSGKSFKYREMILLRAGLFVLLIYKYYGSRIPYFFLILSSFLIMGFPSTARNTTEAVACIIFIGKPLI